MQSFFGCPCQSGLGVFERAKKTVPEEWKWRLGGGGVNIGGVEECLSRLADDASSLTALLSRKD